MANPVLFFEVTGSDGPRLQSFYRDLFEWQVEPSEPTGYGYVESTGEGLGGGIGQTPDGSPGQATFYVGTSDIAATLARVEALGGRTITPRTAIDEHIVIGMLADPEGHTIGLVERS